MIKRLFLISGAALLPFVGMARQISVDEALARFASDSRISANGQYQAKFKATDLAFTAANDGVTAFYVLNATDGNGFAILSADDCALPVLGYSETGAFDLNTLPDNFKWWLSQYQAEIESAVKAGAPTAAPSAAPRRAITPLVRTKWNQNAPYNNLCPTIDGQPTYTGCVATAMAQIMNYHKWPAQPQGTNTYIHDILGEISYDFSQVTFSWDAMANTYDADSPQESCDAVAQLMYACGMAVNMGFNTGESWAFISDAPNAFLNYFNYDLGMGYYQRKFYYSAEWEDMIYNELAAGRPLIYSGQTPSGKGHSFICDGYSQSYFHINWGWGGLCDGYYTLSSLNPPTQGIGGADGAYNIEQTVIMGLRRPTENPESVKMVVMYGNFLPKQESFAKNEDVLFISDELVSSGFYNMGMGLLKTHYGVKVVDAAGNVTYCKGRYENDLDHRMGIGQIRTTELKSLAPGTYTVTPAFDDMETGQWYDVLVPIDKVRSQTMVVTDTEITFPQTPDPTTITLTNTTLLTPVYVGKKVKISTTILSNKETSVTMRCALFAAESDVPVLWTNYDYVALAQNEPLDYEFIGTMNIYDRDLGAPEAGEYDLVLVDKDFNPLSDRIPVTLHGQEIQSFR